MERLGREWVQQRMTHPSRSALTLLACCGVAALSLAACNKTTAPPNGAYVQDADVTTPATSGATTAASLPPRGQYVHAAYTPPPPLPAYDQPPIPGPGYIWTPGYWDWSDSDSDYYWVPGAWVEPPDTGLFWTPGYWRYYNGSYLFADGYWGPSVGFYGGVNYGYGYGGDGYGGGRWQGGRFYYNAQTNNLGGQEIPNVYSQSPPAGGSRVSFNGGQDGLRTQPTPEQVQAAQAHHAAPTHLQVAAASAAQAVPQQRASVNHGAPPIAATARAGDFHATTGVTAARSTGDYTPPPRPASASQRVAPSADRAGVAPAPQQPTRPAFSGPATQRAGAVHDAAPAQAYRAPPVERAQPRMTAPVERPPVERAPAVRAAPPTRAAPAVHAAAPAAPRASAPRPAAPAAAADRREPPH
jgi:hypothetical protein